MSTLYKFEAPYDHLVKVTTSLVIAFMTTLFACISYIAIIEGNDIGILVSLSLAALYFLIVFLPYLFSPRGFALTTRGVLIKRPLKSILIPYNEIIGFKRIIRASPLKSVRLWGSGGLYGFVGLFRMPDLGRVWMYVTDRSRMLLLETKRDVKYIISPSDPSMFIERMRVLAPNAEHRS